MGRTLYEEILNMPDTGFHDLVLREIMNQSEIIQIDNVVEYLRYSDVKSHWEVTDFPNVAPPFHSFFMEFNHSVWTTAGNFPNNNRVGLLFCVNDMRNTINMWEYIVFVFAYIGYKLGQSNVGFNFGCDALGNLSMLPNATDYILLRTPKHVTLDATLKSHLISLLHPCLLAISFLHCKNVELIDNKPTRYKRDRHKSRPHITFKTLRIEPMKKVLCTEGKSEHTGLKLALHICRGHFKDFRDGRGLFGRHKNVYWWDSQVRGDISAGIVNKDYSISSPSEE